MNIILTGSIGAGKGVAVKFFEEKGFKVKAFHDPVYKEVEKLGIEPTRENLQNVSKTLKEKYGNGVYGKILREIAEKEGGDFVFDGLRNLDELEELKKLPETYLVAIVAPLDVLVERVQSRKRDADSEMDHEEIVRKILIEMGELPSPFGFEINKCIEKADLVVENIGTINEMREKLEDFLEKNRKK